MKRVLALVQKVATSSAPVLLYGETGVGKEVVAEAIHWASPRSRAHMVSINCAALPAELIESELFGAVKGSYTGSRDDKLGLFAAAHKGTVFLDELSEMPLGLQSKLLRVLQDKMIRKVGSTESVCVDVRPIAALNKSPSECIKLGLLRDDLYFRLSTITLCIPPLRDRMADIIPMATAYLAYYCEDIGRPVPDLMPETRKYLMAYAWPGNVRQLQNEMNRCAILCDRDVQIGDLSLRENTTHALAEGLSPTTHGFTLMEDIEKQAIIDAIKAEDGNVLATSERLGIGRQTLYSKITRYNLKELVAALPRASRAGRPPKTGVESHPAVNGADRGLAPVFQHTEKPKPEEPAATPFEPPEGVSLL